MHITRTWFEIISTILGTLSTGAALYAVIRVAELHVIVNSRLTELLKVTGSEQRALGDTEGTNRERSRKD
jgi:hypothetical protein